MPKAKAKSKSKKKGGGGKSSITSGVANLSLSSSPPLLNDASPLIFSSNAATQDGKLNFSLPYIGPIALSQSVVHGRGLVVTRDVAAGECLFVIPSVAAAPMDKIYSRFVGEEEDYDDIDDNVDDSNLNKDGSYLEAITEEMLIQQIQQLMDIIDDEEAQPKENVEHAQNLLHAFITQMSSDEVPSTETDVDELTKTLLLSKKKKERYNNMDFNIILDRDTILNIIRRNAFGPDFHHYDKIASFWNTNSNGKKFYERLLGVYPLSAMINHSCSPNAVKVFGRIPSSCLPNGTGFSEEIQGREVMIVHANMAIAKGTEIMWSYIPPSNPCNERREALLSKFGFKCNCSRCVQEEEALKTNPLITSGTSVWDTIQAIEQNLSCNEIRISYATLYLQYFNTTIPSVLHRNDKVNDILKLATRLHFSFLSCNNACTEHLSLLHMCYELAGMLHTHAMKHVPNDTTKTLSQVRFWTEQIKKTVMIRYGQLGESLDNVREIMKHSRLVLRTKDGWYSSNDKFI